MFWPETEMIVDAEDGMPLPKTGSIASDLRHLRSEIRNALYLQIVLDALFILMFALVVY